MQSLHEHGRSKVAGSGDYPLFISYERESSSGWSLMLYDHLSARFGEGAVFRDAQSIGPGEPWKPVFKRRITACRGLILVISPDWQGPRVLQKLQNPNGWVHQEILTALEQGKVIFPVLCGGAVAPPLETLPESIRPALDAFNHFQFHDGPTWKQELDYLCAEIEQRTGLVRHAHGAYAEIQLYDRMLARLDRNRQTAALRTGFEQGGQLFMATGVRKGGFRHFAIRCLLDVLSAQDHGGSSNGERVIALSWARFSDPESAVERRREQLGDIEEKLIADAGRQDPQHLLERISQAVQQTRRRIVLYSTVTSGSLLDADRVAEWFGTWREILRSGQSPRVIVILFIEQGWWPVPPWAARRARSCDAPVRPRLGTVSRGELRQWLEDEVRNRADGGLWNKINRQCERAFRWHRARGFEDICNVVTEVWTPGQG